MQRSGAGVAAAVTVAIVWTVLVSSVALTVTIVVAGAVLAGGATGLRSSAEQGWPEPTPIRWRTCSDSDLAATATQCATVTVPLDWSAPRDGRVVRLAISRVRHTESPYQGVMVVGAGGPGGSGLRLSSTGGLIPNGVGARYDWIGFDPRGVGASSPRLSCDPDYANGPRPPYDPTTTAVRDAWRARVDAYAAECGRRGGDLLQHITTRDSANDVEYLRIALRVDGISWYGFSYGTYLGQVYATLYPNRVRRMVLDSNVDPTRVWYGANLDQDRAFQVVLDAWFDWIAQYPDDYGLGTTRAEVNANYERLRDRLAAKPADGVFGSAEMQDTLLQAGYSQSFWSYLATGLSSAVRVGDTAVLQQSWRENNDLTDDNGYAVYLAVQCTDASWPTDWATWDADNATTAERAPFDTWLNGWYNAPCRTWRAKSGTPVVVDGRRAPPILLVGETLDAATPFSGSLEVRKRFPRASLLAEPGGTTHADSLSGNECVDETIAAYLRDGTLPTRRAGAGPDKTCSPLPVPTP